MVQMCGYNDYAVWLSCLSCRVMQIILAGYVLSLCWLRFLALPALLVILAGNDGYVGWIY